MIAATPKHRPLERLEIRRVERPPGPARERVEPNAVHRSNRCCVRCSQRSRIFFTIEDHINAGERVATRLVAEGTNTGPFAGARPTGKPIRVGGHLRSRSRRRVAERWEQWDQPAMLRQLGLA